MLNLIVAVLVSVCGVAAVQSSELDGERSQALQLQLQWDNFKETYGKTYSTMMEEKYRYSVFVESMVAAAAAQKMNPLATFGVTKFSDLTEEEFSIYHNSRSYYKALNRTNSKPEPAAVNVTYPVPNDIDWVAKGAVTGVKDQKHCGSCWAFSAVGNIEGMWQIAGNKLTSLSEQELVSCSYTSGGCQGGLMDSAFKWLMSDRSGDIMPDAPYPYVSGDGTTRPCKHLCKAIKGPATDDWCSEMCYNEQGKALCTAELCDCSRNPRTPVGATISGFEDLPKDEGQLKAWLSQNGPIAIGVAVPLGRVWQGYTGGIMTNCGASTPDHGVLLVGYGADGGTPYWKVKNSWGATWGEKGYIRLKYGTNQCNLVYSPSSSKI